MSNVISFPKKTPADTEKVPLDALDLEESTPVLSSVEEDNAFLSLIREWPCFVYLDPDINLQGVFELYYDDELNLSQDCVLEYMFHMNDPNSSFDIATALYTWSDDDRNFFILSLNMHAELIDLVKGEEL